MFLNNFFTKYIENVNKMKIFLLTWKAECKSFICKSDTSIFLKINEQRFLNDQIINLMI